MNRLSLSKTNPLLTIFWQVSFIAFIVFVITLFTSTNPLFRGFDLFFFPFLAFIIGFTVVPLIHALFTPGGLEYCIKLSLGSPQKGDDKTGDTSTKKPLFHYERNESFSFGRRK